MFSTRHLCYRGGSPLLLLVFVTCIAAALRVRPDPAFTRRQLAAAAALPLTAVTLSPQRALAEAQGGVSWTLELPPQFAVQERLASIVRVRVATMLKADDEQTGVTIKLLLLPFGKQTGGSLDGDEQLAVAEYFFNPPNSAGSPEVVAKTMTGSAARSPGITSLARVGGVSGYEGSDGARYVKYAYESARCSGEVYDGECLGSLSSRRTLALVSMSSLSQYRTNTERERMKELGQERNVQVLWLLTLSAPSKSWASNEAALERIAATFRVPLKPS